MYVRGKCFYFMLFLCFLLNVFLVQLVNFNAGPSILWRGDWGSGLCNLQLESISMKSMILLIPKWFFPSLSIRYCVDFLSDSCINAFHFNLCQEIVWNILNIRYFNNFIIELLPFWTISTRFVLCKPGKHLVNTEFTIQVLYFFYEGK